MSSYLHPDPDVPLFGVNALKLWLKGDITTPDFLTSENGGYADKGGRDGFSLKELHRALYVATLEISRKLDPELEYAATQAGGYRYSIAVDVDDFYEGRDSELRSLIDLEGRKREDVISTYDRDAVLKVLEQAREEVGWLESQGRRLEVHMEVAEEMKKLRLRNTFVFRPVERSWRVSSDAKDVEMQDGDAVEAEVDPEEILEMMEDEVELEEETMEMAGEISAEMPERAKDTENAMRDPEKRLRKERLEMFKREADVGFGTGSIERSVEGEEESREKDDVLEEGELQEKNDSPVIGLGVKEEAKKKIQRKG